MTWTVFFAVILAAMLHATWNGMAKGSADKELSMAGVIIGHVPYALVALVFFVPLPAWESWPWIILGMIAHFGYQIFLINAYRIGDLTQVYPIARGAAPLIVTAVSITILGVDLAPLQLAGVGTIVLGLFSLALVRGADGLRNSKAAGMAIITGCFIAGYSLADGIGARIAGTAVGYYSVLALLNAVVFAIYLAIWRPGVLPRLPTEGARTFVIGGGASFAAYSLVVWGFTQAPIAVVTALRETSIVFALLIGVFALGERLSLGKVIATFLSLVGAAMLRLARF
jgi:drug/metabolite transporter (DMT)-like permease